jgi:signal transduction histidine kinase
MTIDERIHVIAAGLDAMGHEFAGAVQRLSNATFLARSRGQTAHEQVQQFEREFIAILDRWRRLAEARRPVELQSLSTDDLANRLASSFASVDVVVSSRGLLTIDADLVALATEELVRNAMEFAASGGTPRVLVTGGEHPCVRVQGGSTAWPEPATRAIDPLYTSTLRGIGLGLSVAHTVADAHGDRLSFDPTIPTVTLGLGETGRGP